MQKLQGSRFVIPAKAGIQGEQRKEHHLGPLDEYRRPEGEVFFQESGPGPEKTLGFSVEGKVKVFLGGKFVEFLKQARSAMNLHGGSKQEVRQGRMEILANHEVRGWREKLDIPVGGILLEIYRPLGKFKKGEEAIGPLISLSSKDEKPWPFKAGKIALDKYQITWEDRFLSEPATLSIQDLALKAENFSTVPGQKAKASLGFRLKEIGNVAIDGSVGMNPPGADLKVALKGIAIKADSLTGC